MIVLARGLTGGLLESHVKDLGLSPMGSGKSQTRHVGTVGRDREIASASI